MTENEIAKIVVDMEQGLKETAKWYTKKLVS